MTQVLGLLRSQTGKRGKPWTSNSGEPHLRQAWRDTCGVSRARGETTRQKFKPPQVSSPKLGTRREVLSAATWTQGEDAVLLRKEECKERNTPTSCLSLSNLPAQRQKSAGRAARERQPQSPFLTKQRAGQGRARNAPGHKQAVDQHSTAANWGRCFTVCSTKVYSCLLCIRNTIPIRDTKVNKKDL